jgi:uncharacterized protein (TIGR02246 family)
MSRTDITVVNRAFEGAARARDTDRIAALYTTDAIVMPPDGPFVKGREDIQQFWGSAIQQMGLKDVKKNILTFDDVGDTAYEVGEAALTLASGGATAKYVVIWKNVDGQWRLHRDIWNTKSA